ncbi:unnamed protein product [Cuscuta europaea]|uniref:Uncharacterized protein n=1 Tax=Cuscuta europaea TaxID=41803 RepID=A0A9P0YKH2_CUSEU|nr:unnamed protein product [Cuscuta europaea]
MRRQRRGVGIDGLVPKVRKRGCSSSSSASSRVQHYRLKRAIVVGKVRHGLGGSRSSTPVPSWKTSPLQRTVVDPASSSPQLGTSRPVSARKLAATLWEMNEVPSPKVYEELEKRRKKKQQPGRSGPDSVVSDSLPPHLCDPSHSPVSERRDRSGTGSYNKKMSTSSHRPKPISHVGAIDSVSSASLMEMETRSRVSVSVVGTKTHLKDISNALTTSKELLKIIHRIWSNADPPSSTMSLVSALHAELERARLQVNKLIHQEHKNSDQSEINRLIKCFAEEKAAWKNKEESAIDSLATELETERKLRRRCENLNSKLGKELSETKASLMKAVKELENEKRAREMIEQMCNDLARDISEDRAEVEELKKVHQEFEKEREVIRTKPEEKNSAVDKLRKQLETFLGKKKSKKKGNCCRKTPSDEKASSCINKTPITLHHNLEKEDNREEESAESDLHSIELNMENMNKTSQGTYYPAISRPSKRISVDEMKVRSSLTGQVPRTNTTLLRRISDSVEWGDGSSHGSDWEKLQELENLGKTYAYAEEIQRIKAMAGMKSHSIPVSSPSRQWDLPRSSRDSLGTGVERTSFAHDCAVKSRLGVGRSKW